VVLEIADASPGTKFVVCRFGNVFGSNGSVVRLWQQALRAGRPIRVSDPTMTRFMFPAAEAGDLIEFARTHGETGDIVTPKMRAVLLADLVELFSANGVEVAGPRPGENQHETLYVRGEVATGRETDRYFILNRRATTPIGLDTLDSSAADRVGIDELRQWIAALGQGAGVVSAAA
jgi:UDP-glucose 4-epimerase